MGLTGVIVAVQFKVEKKYNVAGAKQAIPTQIYIDGFEQTMQQKEFASAFWVPEEEEVLFSGSLCSCPPASHLGSGMSTIQTFARASRRIRRPTSSMRLRS